MDLDALDTPFVVVDRVVLERNLAASAERARARGVAWRPHAKTHKSLAIGRRQLHHGAVGLTLATVGEAEIFAAAGFDDLFLAYPIWAAGPRADRLRTLAGTIALRVGLDSVAGADQLADALRGAPVEVVVEVDSGHHRTGGDPRRAGEVAAHAVSRGLDVVGVFTFPGHAYAPGAREGAAADEARAPDLAAHALLAVGIEPRVRSGGTTPTENLPVLGENGFPATETRPGVSSFGDAQQVELGAIDFADCALAIVATVVHSRDGEAVLDAGSKVLGTDRAAWATGHGRLPDRPAARIVTLSEHHATVVCGDGPVPAVGSRVRVVPNHVCTSVNLVDRLVVVQDDEVVDTWVVDARGANS
ncbi:D-serine deaminase, pyridoxal phosphate-dependent [Nocardioides alpinus]|uniref:Alanine racemase n=1 Tax=Nocardioides alpinus TaxID=748909 RepID=A0A1I0ZYT9_9ACTN|nr:alanine racemase [Nocardioides alpinus]PKH42236.1 alanine racemase [Nocardioides alpinus]SFB30905.1 D-serine deaminase, pyridoxal phosphate-dependent [Nocardioides alpinus]